MNTHKQALSPKSLAKEKPTPNPSSVQTPITSTQKLDKQKRQKYINRRGRICKQKMSLIQILIL